MQAQPSGATESARRPAVVWIVEDNSLYLDTTRDLINDQADLCCPFAAQDCERALARVADGEVPDIVLMDIELPGMNGIAGARRLRELAPSARVIMLTVHEERDTVFEAIQAGATGYLLKSSPAERLIEAIREVRDGGAPLNAHIARKILDTLGGAPAGREAYGLTARESEILQLMVDGLTMRKIADALHVSPHTVDTHIRNVYAKLHVHSRGGAVAKALKERLV
jgi:DNA-binding NarL/FixJ family response regulator